MQLLDRVWLKVSNLERKQELLPLDFMNFIERPEVKKLDLSDEEVQAQIDKDVFGM